MERYHATSALSYTRGRGRGARRAQNTLKAADVFGRESMYSHSFIQHHSQSD
jgi:hypothetical protein